MRPKKVFQGPAKATVCIFDVNGADILERCLRGIPQSTIYTRDEKIHLNPLTLFWWIIYGFKHGGGMVTYFQALVKQIQPKVVLTFTDNDSRFYDLAHVFPQMSFIAVQNGWRYPYPVPTHAPARQSLATYLGIGQNDLDGNSAVGLDFKHQEAIGSLRASLIKPRKDTASHTICFPLASQPRSWLRYLSLTNDEVTILAREIVSQLSSGSEQVSESSNRNLESLMAWHDLNDWLLLKLLNAFIGLDPTKSVCVAMRPESSEADLAALDIVKPLLPNLLFAQATKWESTYHRMQSSELVIGTGSTACLEALYLGRKMLLIQSWAVKTQGPKVLPTWWLQNVKPNEVLNAIEELLSKPTEAFLSENKETIEYYSNYPAKKPAFMLVRDLVLMSSQKLIRVHLNKLDQKHVT